MITLNFPKKIEITLEDGISINGRIDLVRRIDTAQTTIVDLKSSDRAQPEQVTETQLHIYCNASIKSRGIGGVGIRN